jgi:hypothetical protein
MKSVSRRSLAGLVGLFTLGLVAAEAQSPSPPRARRSPAPRSTARPAPSTPTPAPAKPRTAVEQLVDAVSAGKPADAADDLSRKLLLATVAVETGSPARALTLLDEVSPLIDQMPKIDPADKEGKRINFRRSGLRSRWIGLTARLDAVKALKAVIAYGEDTNAMHHASLLRSLLEGLDCSPPETKAGVEENVGLLLKPIEAALKERTWGLVHAPQVLETVARAARVCGLAAAGATANDLAKRSVKVFEDTDLSIRACGMAATTGLTAPPADRPKTMATLAKYQLKPRYKGDDPDLCLTDKLYMARDLSKQLGDDDPARRALAGLVGATVAQFNEKTLRYGHCSVPGVLSGLTGLEPGAVDKGVALALAVWRKQDSVDSYCDLPLDAARAGRRLADAGASPAWLCSVLSAQPESKPLTDEQTALLRKKRTLAAVELRGTCPEADGFLQLDRSDVDLLAKVRSRQVVLDRAGTEPLVIEDLRALAPADRYAYATTVLPAFWTKD